MEKHSTRAKRLVRAGLLAALAIFCGQNIFSQSEERPAPVAPQSRTWFTRADAEKLLLVPKDDIFFTNKEAQFILKIPGILPSDVQTELPAFPEGVIFNSSKRGDFFTNEGTMGAEIDLWFTFRKTGTLALPPLIIYVQGRRFAINFKPVEVYENPRTILPKMTFVFEGGETIGDDAKKIPSISLEAGKPARFTIYLQYAIQAQQFAWNIPKDSIFRETKKYDLSATEKSSEFSTKKIPVADFEWTPFAAGSASLPEIQMMAVAYSGRSIYLSTPECLVTITAAKAVSKPQAKEAAAHSPLYKSAWDEEAAQDNQKESDKASPFDCAEIARLRSQERRAFVNIPKVRAQRAAAERVIGLQGAENEPLACVLFVLLGADGILLALAVIFLALKKRFEAALLGIAAAGLLSVTALDANVFLKKRGVIVGGEISPVPEESAMTKTAVSAGSRVLIKEEIQGWYYIVYNESGGWIRKENLAVIK